MIRNDEELAVVRRQLALAEEALASLRAAVEPVNARNCEVLSEGYVDQIAGLQAEIREYQGLPPEVPKRVASERPGLEAGGPAHRPAEKEYPELSVAVTSKDRSRSRDYLRRHAPTDQAGSLARKHGIAYVPIGPPDRADVSRGKINEFGPRVAPVEAQAIEPAPKNVLLSWAAPGVKVTPQCGNIESFAEAVESKTCA